MKKRFLSFLFIFSLIVGITAPVAQGVSGISAQSAILIEGKTGTILYEKNANSPMLIASTTKILTAFLVLETCDLGETVKIERAHTLVEGSSMYLKEGETLTVRDLLYGLMLSSGNDAATALAYHAAGSIEAFADLMNQKVKELGLSASSFKNPHGLDAEGHYSTAHDMAYITAAAMENETFIEIASTKNITVAGRSLQNHNKLLWRYEGALGVKTGYTKSAGRSLVSSAERNGTRLICVTLNAPDDWNDHSALFDWGFTNYRYEAPIGQGEIARLVVISGKKETVGIAAEETYETLLKSNENLKFQIELPRFVYAEVSEGEVLGKIRVLKNGECIKEISLIATESIEKETPPPQTPLERIKNFLKNLF